MKGIKSFGTLILRLAACILAGVLLMTLVYLIPSDKIDSNVKASAALIEEEGERPYYPGVKYLKTFRDNYTDSLMMLESAHPGKNGLLIDAMLNRYGKIEGTSPNNTLVKHYQYGEEFDRSVIYGRYWNGYLLYLKPLMFFFDLSVIRVINIIWQSLLCAAVMFLLFKRRLAFYIIPYTLSVLMTVPFAIFLNIQQSCCLAILNIGLIAMLLLYKKLSAKALVIFLYLGIATAFLDLLTYPLATFGVPAVLYFVLTPAESIKNSFLRMLKTAGAWLLGYAGMWLGKWLVGSLISGRNLAYDGIRQFLFRAGNAGEGMGSAKNFTVWESLYKNIRFFLVNPATLLVIAFVIALIIMTVIRSVKLKASFAEMCKAAFPFLVLAAAPLVWYALIVNHSVVHYMIFTSKALVVSVMAICCMIVKLYVMLKDDSNTNKLRKEIKAQ